MNTANNTVHLAGYLIWCSVPNNTRALLETSPTITSLNEHTLWFKHYVYETAEAIRRVDDPEAEPPFPHKISICWGQQAMLALAARHHVIDYLLQSELSDRFHIPWHHSAINVNGFIRRRLEFAPSTGSPFPPLASYDISQLTAKTEGYRGLVRSISLYGDNVIHTPFFKDHAVSLECTSCALKNETGEILKLGSDGFMSMHVPKERMARLHRIKEVLSILSALRKEDLLSL